MDKKTQKAPRKQSIIKLAPQSIMIQVTKDADTFDMNFEYHVKKSKIPNAGNGLFYAGIKIYN